VTLTAEQQTFRRVLPTRWRRKPAGIGTERNYVTVALCIEVKYTVFEQGHGTGRQTNGLIAASLNTPTVERGGA